MPIALKAEKSSCPKIVLLQMAALGVAQILFSPGFEAAHNTLQPQPATAPPKLPCCGIAYLIPSCFKFCHQHWSLPQTAGEHSDPKQNKSPTVLQSHWLLQLTLRQLTAGI